MSNAISRQAHLVWKTVFGSQWFPDIIRKVQRRETLLGELGVKTRKTTRKESRSMDTEKGKKKETTETRRREGWGVEGEVGVICVMN